MIAEGTPAYNPQTGQTAVFTGGKWAVLGSPAMPINAGDQEAMNKDAQTAQEKMMLSRYANQFMQTQGRGNNAIATGPGYDEVKIPIPLLDKINLNPTRAVTNVVNPNLASKLQDLDAINGQAFTLLRPPDSGSLRGPEITSFKQAFPNVENFGQTNADITDRLSSDAQNAAQKLAFIDNYIKAGKGNYPDANVAWLAGQQGNISQSPLPPVQGNNPYGQPSAGPAYNQGQHFQQGYTPPVSQSPAATPMQMPPQGSQPQAAPQGQQTPQNPYAGLSNAQIMQMLSGQQ